MGERSEANAQSKGVEAKGVFSSTTERHSERAAPLTQLLPCG
jgi:hypothetical protein